MAKPLKKYYALKNKEEPRVFLSWQECLDYRAEHNKGVFRVFNSSDEAKKYLGIGNETPLTEALRIAGYDGIADDLGSKHIVKAVMQYAKDICSIAFVADTGETSAQVLRDNESVKTVVGIANDLGIDVDIPVAYMFKLMEDVSAADDRALEIKKERDQALAELDSAKTVIQRAREAYTAIKAEAEKAKSDAEDARKQAATTHTEPPDIPQTEAAEQMSLLPDDATKPSVIGNTGKTAVIYSDGSFDKNVMKWGYGTIVYDRDDPTNEYLFYGRGTKYAEHWNIAGELVGAIRGIQEAINLGYKAAIVRYDYLGIEKWATGEWSAKNDLSNGYRSKVRELMAQINITFEKVKAHSGETYNERVDMLAKQALGLVS